MQTILGANGVIGRELAAALPLYTNAIRLVSRSPKKVHISDELLAADLTNAEQTMKAVEGSDVVYLTAGLVYNVGVWRQQWPVIMRNVLNACQRYDARFVFFDNVYAYGIVQGSMTEKTPVRPSSAKGEVRAQVAAMLMDAVERGHVQAQIVRAADFYGPGAALSFVTVMVFDNLRKGKKAQWMLNADMPHSFTYTPDAGKATALLGNTAEAYNDVWHLPTAAPPLTGRQFVEIAAREFGVPPGCMVLPRWMLRLVGVFSGVVAESMEMLYQYDAEYVFDSSKFTSAFGVQPTSYQEGIRATAASMKSAQ